MNLASQPVLEGSLVRLEQLTEAFIEGYWRLLNDADGARATGTHRSFELADAEAWLSSRAGQPDRADWAIVSVEDGTFLGEAVINDVDEANESAGFRIALVGASAYGRGYGTEATRLVVDYALRGAGFHRLSLEVYAFNERARHVYETCGFIVEGRLREALLWDGERHDAIVMAVLRADLVG